MKRIITIIVAVGLIVPAVAVASRLTTGGTRNAIDRAAAPQLPPGIPERCLSAQVTTKDGGNWATVGFNGLHYRSCGRWGFNGVVILRRAHGRWDYVTAGSAMLPCGRLGIPVAVRHDLHLPCRSKPGTLHLQYFVSPDKGISCDINSDGTPGAFCDSGAFGGNGFHSGGVQTSGKVTICNHPPGGDYCGALGGNFPILHYGQRDELYGLRCTSTTNGITCIVATGTAEGKGFRINTHEAVQVR